MIKNILTFVVKAIAYKNLTYRLQIKATSFFSFFATVKNATAIKTGKAVIKIIIIVLVFILYK
jgi:hypothetical protein